MLLLVPIPLVPMRLVLTPHTTGHTVVCRGVDQSPDEFAGCCGAQQWGCRLRRQRMSLAHWEGRRTRAGRCNAAVVDAIASGVACSEGSNAYGLVTANT